MAWHAFNLHAHSTVSDGQRTPEEIARFAEERGVFVAITDHNAIDAHLSVRSPNVIAGVEIRTGEEGVDILALGERERVIAFFKTSVEPFLDPHDPCFRPASRHPLDVIGDALEAQLQIVIPHYALPDGLSVLDVSLQRTIARLPVFVELNGQMPSARNARAAAFACVHGLPLIAADDTHYGDYARTLTRVQLPAGTIPTLDTLLAEVRRDPAGAEMIIRPPSVRETLATLWQIGKNIAPSTMLTNPTRKLAHLARGALRDDRTELETQTA